MFRKFCVVFRENCVVFHKYCVVFRENCVVFRELFVVFQEYVVVFADMGHRSTVIPHTSLRLGDHGKFSSCLKTFHHSYYENSHPDRSYRDGIRRQSRIDKKVIFIQCSVSLYLEVGVAQHTLYQCLQVQIPHSLVNCYGHYEIYESRTWHVHTSPN